jgi:hypothetical protein
MKRFAVPARRLGSLPGGLVAETHWVSSNSFTVEVKTDERGVIVWAAPLVKRFLGQPIGNLLNWAKPFGGLRREMWK